MPPNQVLDFPIDLQNEQVVLGNALAHPEARDLFQSSAQHDWFLDDKNKVVAWCLLIMMARDIEITEDSFTLVAAEYPGTNKEYGGNTYIATLRRLCPNQNPNYGAHLNKLKTDQVKATVAKRALVKVMTAMANPGTTLAELEDGIEAARIAVQEHRPVEIDFVHGVELYDAYMEIMRKRADTEVGTFMTTGFEDLDELLIEGMAKTKISVVGGFTGMAKSAFVTNAMERQAGEGLRVGCTSLEMVKESMVDRMVSTITQYPLDLIIKNPQDMTRDEKLFLHTVVQGIRDTDLIWINDRAVQTLNSIDAQLAMLKQAGTPLDIIYIDLFGKLDDVSVADGLASNIEHKLRKTREIARRHNVHICVVVQIKRYFDMNTIRPNRPVPRPKLDKIKNSGAFAEEADLVLLLHRNKYYKPDLENDVLEIEVAKQRQGVMGTYAFFEYLGECTKIRRTDWRPDDWGDDEAA